MLKPMVAMVGWMIVVFLVAFISRLKAVKSGDTSIKYFRTYDEGTTNAMVRKSTRHYSNLFEMPMLFMAACLTLQMMGWMSPQLVSIAYGYVLLRIVHGVIHMGYNNVIHRMLAFQASNLCLFALWGVIAYQLWWH